MELSLPELESFIVRAKAATYAGNGTRLLPYRCESQDLQYREGEWAYHDSSFGNSDFAGQEIVYLRRRPVWAMNYYGRIVRDDLLSAAEAGAMIKRSLSALYREGRFLGGFRHIDGELFYVDVNEGTVAAFQGKEWITRGGETAYQLKYHGGQIRS